MINFNIRCCMRIYSHELTHSKISPSYYIKACPIWRIILSIYTHIGTSWNDPQETFDHDMRLVVFVYIDDHPICLM